MVAAINEGNDGVLPVDFNTAPPAAQTAKAMRSTLPQCLVGRLVLRQSEKLGFQGMAESELLRETSFEPWRVPDAEEVYRQTQ